MPCVPVGIGTPRGDLREFGIAVDGDAPAGAVGQVPVEAVELVAGHQIELLLDELLVAEMARDVEHQTAVREAGRIGDLERGELAAEALGELQQRLHAVEGAGGIGRGEEDPLGRDREAIALGRDRVVGREAQEGLGIGCDERKPLPVGPSLDVGHVGRSEVARAGDRFGKDAAAPPPRDLLRSGRDARRARTLPAAGGERDVQRRKAEKEESFHKSF